MARDLTLDPKAATDASKGSNRISRSGTYPGKITAAWGGTNKNKNEFVGLVWKGDNGDQLQQDVYIFAANGQQLSGFGIVQALMTCVRVRELKATRGQCTRYDFELRDDVTIMEDIYADLVDKPVGLIVQMVEDEYQGKVSQKPDIRGWYELSTNMVAAEILGHAKEARTLDSQRAWLEANPVYRKKPKAQAATVSSPVSGPATAGGGHDFDDVPFAMLARRQHW